MTNNIVTQFMVEKFCNENDFEGFESFLITNDEPLMEVMLYVFKYCEENNLKFLDNFLSRNIDIAKHIISCFSIKMEKRIKATEEVIRALENRR